MALMILLKYPSVYNKKSTTVKLKSLTVEHFWYIGLKGWYGTKYGFYKEMFCLWFYKGMIVATMQKAGYVKNCLNDHRHHTPMNLERKHYIVYIYIFQCQN